jgi:hypothetical protein
LNTDLHGINFMRLKAIPLTGQTGRVEPSLVTLL